LNLAKAIQTSSVLSEIFTVDRGTDYFYSMIYW